MLVIGNLQRSGISLVPEIGNQKCCTSLLNGIGEKTKTFRNIGSVAFGLKFQSVP